MKRLLAIGALLVVLACIFVGWGSMSEVGAQLKKYFSGNPDLPPQMAEREDSDGANEAEFIARREEQIALMRGYEPGKPFDPAARTRAIRMADQQVLRIKSNVMKKTGASQLTVSGGTWFELGPAPVPNGQTQGVTRPVSGRVTAIEVDPTDPNKVYVGAAQGGVFRSLDGGSTWTPIFDGAQSLAIGALTLDAANGRLYVGTGEANGSADSFGGVGLYRIDNVNTTATLVGPINPVRNYNDASGNPQSVPVFNGRSISKILIVPNDPTTLFVGTAGGAMGIGADAPFGGSVPPLGLRGLYKLTSVTSAPASVGVSRITVRSGSGIEGCFDIPCTGNRNVNDLVFDPGDVTGNTLILWLNGINVANDGGVWRTTNALAATPTFSQSFATTSTSTSNGRGALAIYKQGANPAVVYCASGEPSTTTACTSTASNSGAVRVSTDGGVTFGATKLQGAGGFCGGQCFYNIGFDVNQGGTTLQTDDILLLGGNVRSTNNCARLAAKSTDGGATFTDSSTSGVHADTHAIKIAPSDSSIVYRGDDGGIWKSTDGGVTWSSLNNSTFRASQYVSIAVHPIDPFFTIGGTQDDGTQQLLTTGTSFNRIDFGDGGFALIDQGAADTSNVVMYHTYFNQTNNLVGFAEVDTVASAFDGNWSFFGCGGTANGINCTDAVNFYAPMALGPGSPNTVYYGSDRLYRSANKGVTATAVSQAPITAGVPISSIAISRQDDNYRLVGQDNGGLFFTTTGSSTLTSLDAVGGGSAIPDKYVGRVLIDPSNKNTAYIALGGFMGGTTAALSHVWKVTNLNTTPVLTGINGSGLNILPDVPVNAFAVDPTNANQLYAGTDIGVYSSSDGGATWQPLGAGLPRIAVFGMALTAGQRKLRVATHGRGMWEINVSKKAAVADFDGDGKTDLSVFRPTDNNWYAFKSSGTGALIQNWGVAGDVLTPGDYDGDGKTDTATFRPSTGQWLIFRSSDSTASILSWGVAGDKPVAGDYDGDGKTDVAQFRPSDGNWYVFRSSDSGVSITNWGVATDVPVQGDYDADGKTDVAVFRPSTGQWFAFRSTAGPYIASWGVTGDKPVEADYDGDGKTDIAVFRPSDGNWYIFRSSDSGVQIVNWGSSTDVPVPGDYDGDGKADEAIFRNGTWFAFQSTSGPMIASWGTTGDSPIPAKYIP